MRSPRRQHVGIAASGGGGGGRREASPPLRAVRVRDHQRDEWSRDTYRERGRSPSPRAARERLRRLSPESVKRKRREYASASSSFHAHSAQPRAEYLLDDGDGRARGGYDDPAFETEYLSDRYFDLQRPIRMMPPSSLDAEEVRVPRPMRHVEDSLGRREVVVQRLPRFSGDARVGREIVVSRALRFFEDDCGGKDSIVPKPPRYLEDGQSGHETLVPKPGYLEDSPAHAFLSQPMDHRPGIYALGSGSGAKSSPRSGVHGEEERDLCYRHRLEDGYDGGDREKIYSRDAPYPGLLPLQMRAISGLPSGLSEDGSMVHSYQDSLHLPAKDSYNISNASNLSDEAFRHEEHVQTQHLHASKRQVVSPLIREDGQNEGYSEFVRRESNNRLFPLLDDNTPNQMPWEPQDGYGETLNPGYTFPSAGRIDESGSSSRTKRKAYLLDHQSSVEKDCISAYRHATHVSEEYPLGRESIEYRPRLMKGCDLSHGETEYDYEGDNNLLESYKGRSRISLMHNQFDDVYRENASPTGRIINTQDVDMYNVSDDRALRRYLSDEEVDEIDNRNYYLTTYRGHGRELDSNEDHWTSEDRTYQASKRCVGGRLQHRILHRRASDPNNQHLHRSSLGSREVQRVVNLKRRLRQEPSKFVVNFQFKRKQDFYYHHRYWKKNEDHQHHFGNIHEADVQEDHKHVQRDPPENSEEFKQQVHKAFLRFSKLLNEDPNQQKRYKEQGKDGSLLCCICGSLSKEFVDSHSLVMHAFNSLKIGLRTDHLGLHKALCVLMGWNWQVAPDGGKYYQSIPPSEATAMKEDLILWPPLVIIHNSSIGNNKNGAAGSKIVNKEGLENILRGIGVGVGKARVGLGKPADHSIMLAKFLPTFSGLQEAEKLHKHYLDNGRGRNEFKSLDSVGGGGDSSGSSEEMDGNVEQLLYGYLAISEDLDKLDNNTKKRSIVKSKMEIEAIADAPLTSKEPPDVN